MTANAEDLAPRTPPGQVLTTKWPVLTYGLTPKFNPKTWTFRCFGLVEEDVSWSWEEFLALPRSEVMKRVRLKPEAKFAMIHADPDYTTNLPLADLVDDDVILALSHDGKALEPNHGGPLRLVVPKLYFWKSAKWLRGFEFLDVNPPGFWEANGYHMHADPWKDERYS